MTAAKITFDTAECTRCGGKGRIAMYAHVAGGVCAKCNGSGKQLSRRGAAAERAYQAELIRRHGKVASSLVVGDTFEGREIVSIEDRDGGIYLNFGNGSIGLRPRRLCITATPQDVQEIGREIAEKFAGATYR
jgi:hypothetical protein